MLVMFVSSCGQRSKITDYAKQQDLDVAGYFSDSVTKFSVDVFYESTAEPYTGPIEDSPNNTWDITEQSFAELFKTHTRRQIFVPHQTTEMRTFPERHVQTWDEKQLIALATSITRVPTGSEQIANVIFIKGSYMGESTVLGIHFSGYKVAFIFKDNLKRFSGGTAFLRHIEQATVVHELGHVVGLVNNGLPMVQNHEDAVHPHHSLDSDDIMYWDLIAAVSQIKRLILFGKYSLADAQAFHKP